jgi:hypothetical protein
MKRLFLLVPLLAACLTGGRGDGLQPELPGEMPGDLLDRFPFVADQPIDVTYQCERVGSVLAWTFHLAPDGTLVVAFTTDTHEDHVFYGTYTHGGGAIRLSMPPGPAMPFPLGLDETSTVIFPQLGIVAGFATPEMTCVAIGHGMNAVEPMDTVDYTCPLIRYEAATDEENAIELVHRAVPFAIPVPGSSFRQRDVWIVGADQPNVTRAYGIYRRDGDRMVVSFQVASDFARAHGALLPTSLSPNAPFADHNVLSGTLVDGGQGLLVDQLEPESGACTRR